jgi:hypothetical protein
MYSGVQMAFKFSFHPKELSGLKGLIAERLVRAYLDKVLIPKLKNEFDFVFADLHLPFLPLSFVDSALLLGKKVEWDEAWNEIATESYIVDSRSGKRISYEEYAKKNKAFKKRWKDEHIENATTHIPRKVLATFLEKRVFPSPELFDETIKVIALLENAPDGFIFKLSDNGQNLSSFNYIKAFSKWRLEIFEELELHAPPKEIPVVSGEIEVIEIKADEAFIMPHQAEGYKKIIAEGCPLRYFHVALVSFEKNQFEIEEKLVRTASELEVILRRRRKRRT